MSSLTEQKIVIAEQKAACEVAWLAHPEATWAWCLHHEIILEPLRQNAMNRISFIDKYKAQYELADRFMNFRPVLDLSVLPVAVREAGQRMIDCSNTSISLSRAGLAYDSSERISERKEQEYAVEVYGDMLRMYSPELKALLDKYVPDNTWGPNSNAEFGGSIFPNRY